MPASWLEVEQIEDWEAYFRGLPKNCTIEIHHTKSDRCASGVVITQRVKPCKAEPEGGWVARLFLCAPDEFTPKEFSAILKGLSASKRKFARLGAN